MRRTWRSWGFFLALIACVSLFGHADCHAMPSDTATQCALCHTAIYTTPVVHVPTPIFYTQTASFPTEAIGVGTSSIAVDLTRGPPTR